MRYLPMTPADRQEMLAAVDLVSVEELYADVPGELLLRQLPELPQPLSETELVRHFDELAAANRELLSFQGAGAYDHFIPASVPALAGRSEFFTAYTPYQPELSQGMLQSIYEYQTSICRLTGLDAANASMYDGASALAEAALMACGLTGRSRIAVAGSMHPEYRQTIATYLAGQGLTMLELPLLDGRLDSQAALAAIDDDLAGMLLQTPNFFGLLEDEIACLRHKLDEHGGLLVISSDPLSLGVCRTPAEWGADIAAGEGQPLGISLSFGGPYLGWLACRRQYTRRLPGRIVGATKDRQGRPCYVLTLQAREQHIRRQRAASNICSNEALMALTATIYLSSMGPAGMQEAAGQCLQKSAYALERLSALKGCSSTFSGPFFREFTLTLPGSAEEALEFMSERGIAGGVPLGRFYPDMENCLLVCVTEKRSRQEIDNLVEVMEAWLRND